MIQSITVPICPGGGLLDLRDNRLTEGTAIKSVLWRIGQEPSSAAARPPEMLASYGEAGAIHFLTDTHCALA